MRRIYINIGLICLLSIVVVTVFYMLPKKPLKNGFERGKIYQAKKLRELDLNYNSYYISGLSASQIFLGNYSSALTLLSCGYDLTTPKLTKIPFTYNPAINWRLAKIQVDSPSVYLSEYKTPSFVSALLPFSKEKTHNIAGIGSDQLKVLSSHSLIVNGYNPVLNRKALQKIHLVKAPEIKQVFPHKLQLKGGFGIDGYLSYNKDQGKIIFTYYYRNQFLCLDTNLKLLYTGNTIDTNKTVKIKVIEWEKDGKRQQAISPKSVSVNKRGYTSGNWIYNEAALPGDNEKKSVFDVHVIIDVYNVNNGKYSHSIYLPRYRGRKLTDFAVKDSTLIVLFGRFMVTYGIKMSG